MGGWTGVLGRLSCPSGVPVAVTGVCGWDVDGLCVSESQGRRAPGEPYVAQGSSFDRGAKYYFESGYRAVYTDVSRRGPSRLTFSHRTWLVLPVQGVGGGSK